MSNVILIKKKMEGRRDEEYAHLAKEFRYQEFPDGDYLDDMLENEARFKRFINMQANEFLRREEMLGSIFESEFEAIKDAIMAEFGLYGR